MKTLFDFPFLRIKLFRYREFGMSYWIGVNDIAKEGVYVDMTNTKQTFLPWASTEPNNKEVFYTATCLLIVSTGDVFDARCNVKFPTFCAHNNGNNI